MKHVLMGDTRAFVSQINDPAYTKLLIHSDTTNGSTTFTDSSSEANVLTANGNVQHSTTQKKFGATSIKFDGTGDYISLPYNSALRDTTGLPWCIDFWVYFDDVSGDRGFFGNHRETSSYGLYWTQVNNNVAFNDGVGATQFSAAWNPSAGQWYHFAMTRTSTTLAGLYINGTRVATTTGGSFSTEITAPMYVGRATTDNGSTYMYHNGYIDEFRIVVGKDMWQSGSFTTPKDPYA